MKSYILVLVGIVALYSQGLCDNIYLKSGYVHRNVTILDTVDNVLRVKQVNGVIRLHPLNNIYRINRFVADTTIESSFVEVAKESEVASMMNMRAASKEKKNFTYPNLILLPLSLVATAVAIDYFGQATDNQNEIDARKKIAPNGDYGSLEDVVMRKKTIAYFFIGAGVLNAVFAVLPVEVRITPNEVKLSYAF